MRAQLRNGKAVQIRLLQQEDKESLYNYLRLLSPESRSRFGPHPFDRQTVDAIFDQPDTLLQRYVAIDPTDKNIVAYMLVRQADQQRYAERNQYLDFGLTATFAPSVTDALAGHRPWFRDGKHY